MESEDDQDEFFRETSRKTGSFVQSFSEVGPPTSKESEKDMNLEESEKKNMKMEETEEDNMKMEEAEEDKMKMEESGEKSIKKTVSFWKDGDDGLTPNETKVFRVVFDLCDVNCDGFLSVAELESQIIRLVLQAKEKTTEEKIDLPGEKVEDEEDGANRLDLKDIPEFEIVHMIHELDEHKTGSLNWQDFCHAVKHKYKDASGDHNLKNCLKVLDLRGEGYVNSLELREFVTTKGLKPLTKAEADEFLHVADPEGEGVVDCDELIKWILNNQPKPQKSGTEAFG